jgi:hypothetical protein
MKKIMVMLITLLISCSSVKENNKLTANAALKIALKKGACFGTCPIYQIRLFEDRSVKYNGIRFVESQGTFEWYMDRSDFDKVTKLLKTKELKSSREYNMRAQDLPLTSLSIYSNTSTIEIKHKGGITDELKERIKSIEYLIMKNASWKK